MSRARTFKEIAEDYDVSLRTVQEWWKKGELRAINVSRDRSSRKPRLRVTQADLDAFLASRAVGVDPPPARRRRRAAVRQYV